MLYSLYEYHLRRKLKSVSHDSKKLFPEEICFLLSSDEFVKNPGKLGSVCEWCMEFSEIEKIIFHISLKDSDSINEHLSSLEGIGERTSLRISSESVEKRFGDDDVEPKVLVVLGKSGREEITDAIIKIAKEDVKPDSITEEVIESHLQYKVKPDFVIKTGGDNLTDFLIWQSVYSELFFTDVNWSKFRRVDLYRALRDYQSRVRRYGK